MPSISLNTPDGYTINVSQTAPAAVSVSAPAGPQVVNLGTASMPDFVVAVPGIQGPGNLHVGPTNQLSSGPGLWVQTGLGLDGSGFTFWIEDGV